jgi:hypothetical protein
MKGNDYKIVYNNGKSEVYIDGKKIENLRSVEFEHSFDCVPTLKIEVMPKSVNLEEK